MEIAIFQIALAKDYKFLAKLQLHIPFLLDLDCFRPAKAKKPTHENVVFDPRIYVAEKEGCLLQ